MFLCYKSVDAQSIQMHCYTVFMINSGHYQYYSTVLNHSKMNLFTDPVPTSQNTNYSFITKTNMPFEKNLFVANHIKHTIYIPSVSEQDV